MTDLSTNALIRPTQNPATRFTPTAPNPMLGTRQMPNALQLPPQNVPPPAPMNPATLPAAPPTPAPAPAPIEGLEDRISTRVPDAKDQGFNPHERNDLTISHEAMRPDYFESKATATRPGGSGHAKAYHGMIDKLRKFYPHINMANMSNDAAAEAFTKHVHDNLVFLWTAARNKPWFNEAKDWYHGANRYAKNLAEEHGLKTRNVAGMIAALSPQTDWNVNVDRVERALNIIKSHQNTPFSAGMREFTQNQINNMSEATDAAKKIKAERQAKLDSIPIVDKETGAGPTLGELNHAEHKDWHRAFFVRAHDELNGSDRRYKIYAPNGETHLSDNKTSWSSYGELAKAMKAHRATELSEISEAMGKNHKVRNFYNNIISPNARHGDVTIDTHAINAGQLMPMGSSHLYVQHGLGVGGGIPETNRTGAHGLYGLYADAYRRAAHTIGRMEGKEILPREVQSATWEAVKGLFNNAAHKRIDAQGEPLHEVGRVAKYWQTLARHHAPLGDGPHTMTMPRARGALYRAAGGINDPEWWTRRQERMRGAA